MLAFFTSLVLLIAAAPMPPFVISTPTPTPLQNIGRTHALTPACSTLRDVIVPALPAVKKADIRFQQMAQQHFPDYVAIVDDPERRNTIDREAMLSRLDGDVTALMQQVRPLQRALEDPRLAARPDDPQMQTLRAQMEQLYDTQAGRAKVLSEYVERQRIEILKADTGVNAFAPDTPQSAVPDPTSAPFAMPQMVGIASQDTKTVGDWTADISRQILVSEDQAARAFLPLARHC